MPSAWQTVRVFISSTFRDMHSERDWLVKRVFPRLRERLEPYRVHLVDVDLRWGVTREQADADEALDVCLQQIDECRPFFLGLLGERYGWVSEHLPDRVFGKWGWIRHHTGKSITELEILYGVLQNSEMRDSAYFCFRDPAFLEVVPAPLQAELRSENESAAEKLRDLKTRIESHTPRLPVLRDYPVEYAGIAIDWRLARMSLSADEQERLERVAGDGLVDPDEYRDLDDDLRAAVHSLGTVQLVGLDAFGDGVAAWLWESIRQRFDLPADPRGLSSVETDPLVEDHGFHERFIESRLRVYVGREDLQRELTVYADGDETGPCLLTAPSGLGKSAALARFVTVYRDHHPDTTVVSHFVGASPTSTNLRQMLRRLCLTIKNSLGYVDEVPQDLNELTTTLHTFLETVPTHRRLVLVLDALNQLDESDNAHALHWLPWEFPAHVKLVSSCIADPDREERVLQAFEHRPHRRIDLSPLTDADRRAILRDVPSLSAKTLDDVQVGLLLANPATRNPLFLLVALEELRGFGSFEHLDRRIAQLPRPHEESPQWPEWLESVRTDVPEHLRRKPTCGLAHETRHHRARIVGDVRRR